jgi:hypothetical protein
MFKNVEEGNFEKGCSVSVRENPGSQGRVIAVEDVKTLFISERQQREAGIHIDLSEIGNLQAGDRLTITGRIGEGSPTGANWSVALIHPQSGQITHHIAPNSVFSLSHILEIDDLDETLIVHTVGWGVVQPTMDFYVDGLLITRKSVSTDDIDIRTVVYSMAEDPGVRWVSGESNRFVNTAILSRSGAPTIRIIKRGSSNAVHISVRVNDFDGMDINLTRMDLRPGNQYRITVKGRIEGNPPPESKIMLQGIPSYKWTNETDITENMEFTLQHTLNRSEMEKWTAIRVTTNVPGASVSFYIYSIEVVKL